MCWWISKHSWAATHFPPDGPARQYIAEQDKYSKKKRDNNKTVFYVFIYFNHDCQNYNVPSYCMELNFFQELAKEEEESWKENSNKKRKMQDNKKGRNIPKISKKYEALCGLCMSHILFVPFKQNICVQQAIQK